MPGAIVYEPGSTVSNKTGSWRSFMPLVDQKKCIKCKQFETFCPDMAITVSDKGDKKVDIDLDYCKGCGICASICPAKAITMQQDAKGAEGFTCAVEQKDKKKVECSE